MSLNVSLLLNVAGELVTEIMEKTEVFNVFSALVFTGKSYLQVSWAPATTEKVWSKEELSLVKEEQVREHLNRLMYTVHGTRWNLKEADPCHCGANPDYL